MKRILLLASAAVAASLLAVRPACAADAAPATDDASINNAIDAAKKAAAEAERHFHSLVQCREFTGTVEVLVPGSKDWKSVEEKRYYPLGSAFRIVRERGSAVAPTAIFGFGIEARLDITNEAEFATRAAPIGDKTRTVVLRRGRIALNLPRALKDGEFTVAAPHFVCRNLSGESWFEYADTGDGDEAVVHVVTGALSVEGAHYKIAQMRAANQLRIRTTGDDLFTSLSGESGDYVVQLDQGLVRQKDYTTGETHEGERYLNFPLSPRCLIKIFRGRAAVGGRIVVSTLTFDAAGELKNRCAFAEKRYNVNSGELVIAPRAVDDANNKKAAAEAAEVEVVPVTPKPAAAPSADAAAPAAPEPAAVPAPAADAGSGADAPAPAPAPVPAPAGGGDSLDI